MDNEDLSLTDKLIYVIPSRLIAIPITDNNMNSDL